MADRTFSGGFRTGPRPVPGSDRRRNTSGLGSEAPIPFAKKTPVSSTADSVVGSEALRRANPVSGTTTSRQITTGTEERTPLSQKNSQFAADFAREAKLLATKRGLTGAQRRAQLGALKNSFALRNAGISEDDPRAKAISGLGEAANQRGLSGLQRRLQTSSASTLLSSVLSGEKNRPLTFDEQLDKKLGI